MYCILQTFVMLGFPTPVCVKLSSLPVWLTKERGREDGPVLCSHWPAVRLSSRKVRAEVERTACRGFQLLNQNSNVSVFIFLPFIH